MPARRRRTGITSLSVGGFKSLHDLQRIDIKPLTIMAGVNSSGKSSMIQPLLLLKQTLEAPYDPGPLLLDGPNINITQIEQVLSREQSRAKAVKDFTVAFQVAGFPELQLRFGRASSGDVRIRELVSDPGGRNSLTIHEGMSQGEIRSEISPQMMEELRRAWLLREEEEEPTWAVSRNRWVLSIRAVFENNSARFGFNVGPNLSEFVDAVGKIIHLSAFRGSPQRAYRTAAVDESYPGVFDNYTAGIISAWQNRSQENMIAQLRADLELLGLTWKVQAHQLDDTRVELLVGRMPHAQRGGAQDLVNIADVGFGVSQTLPVVVALLVAIPGQMVYLEQPEIHLHPRAQAAFSELLQAAVARGARVVVETHSALLIRAIQTLVAKGSLRKEDVALHWFSRHERTGWTTVTSASMDQFGSFGDWPEDFDEVSLKADHDYLTAAEAAEAAAK